MTIQVGSLSGYRLWMIRDGAVRSLTVGTRSPGPYDGLAPWPLTPTSAVNVSTGEPAPTEGGADGWAATKERPWLGNRRWEYEQGGRWHDIFRVVPGVGFAGDVAGRVELWGEVIEGPRGFRAEYMAPTHLTEPNQCVYGANDQVRRAAILLAFAAAWGATICTLEELP